MWWRGRCTNSFQNNNSVLVLMVIKVDKRKKYIKVIFCNKIFTERLLRLSYHITWHDTFFRVACTSCGVFSGVTWNVRTNSAYKRYNPCHPSMVLVKRNCFFILYWALFAPTKFTLASGITLNDLSVLVFRLVRRMSYLSSSFFFFFVATVRFDEELQRKGLWIRIIKTDHFLAFLARKYLNPLIVFSNKNIPYQALMQSYYKM